MSVSLTKTRNKSSKKYKSMNDLSNIKSNFTSLKIYPVKTDFKSGISYTYIPSGKTFYQGVSFNFENTTEKTIKDFYDYYN